MTTAEIRTWVVEELGDLDPMTARMYRSTKRLPTQVEGTANPAVVRVPMDVLRELEAEPGDELDAINNGYRCTVKVLEAGDGRRVLGMDPFDLKRLDLEEGTPMVLRNASM